jgi:hypothetical protein
MMAMASLSTLLRLARDTLANPREGAVAVLNFAPPRDALWLMLALVIVVSMLLGEAVALVAGISADGPLTGPMITNSPLVLGVLQGAFLFVMIHAIHRIGRAFGGTGRFEEAMLLVIWLQFIFILVQLVQILAFTLLPGLAAIITILALGLFFWLLTNFIAVLHGFSSIGMVFVATILSLVGIVFVVSLVLALLGVGMT